MKEDIKMFSLYENAEVRCKFDSTGVQTHDLHIVTAHFMSLGSLL